MKRLKKFKPAFWDHGDVASSHPRIGINFARKWKLFVLFTTLMAILPLCIMAYVDSNLTRQTIEEEVERSMLRVLNCAVISLSLSKDIKKSALDYITKAKTAGIHDIFLTNSDGTLLTHSSYYGAPDIPNTFDTSIFKEQIGIKEIITPDRSPVIVGYARVLNSSLIIVRIMSKKRITDLWLKPRLHLLGYLIVSIIAILLSIMGMATFLVGRIHSADKKKTEILHHAEYKNKLASIGRLSSGVAHEINNPLDIINQKTGLIMDMFLSGKDFSSDKRLIPLTNDIHDAVQRCGAITRRLLDFAQHTEPSIEIVNIEEVIEQMLAFLKKEAERQNITISVTSKGSIPDFECDRGSLQQIFLNLLDNAFAAMGNGGQLDIFVEFKKNENLTIIVSDTGSGIANDDIHKIFEPFYSSKTDHWGTGLGLSITYGLVKEIGGDIMVKSKIGKGTRFTIILPVEVMKVQ